MLTVVADGSPYSARLMTTDPIAGGRIIFRIDQYRLRETPSYQTIQIGIDRHIDDLNLIAFLNHSCRPNVLVDTAQLVCIAVRDIAAGEELTFFYPSTEWHMAQPFACRCGAAECIGMVSGARYLSVDTLSRYFINAHIRELTMTAMNAHHHAVTAIPPTAADVTTAHPP